MRILTFCAIWRLSFLNLRLETLWRGPIPAPRSAGKPERIGLSSGLYEDLYRVIRRQRGIKMGLMGNACVHYWWYSCILLPLRHLLRLLGARVNLDLRAGWTGIARVVHIIFWVQ